MVCPGIAAPVGRHPSQEADEPTLGAQAGVPDRQPGINDAPDAVTARYVLDNATEVQLATARRMNDRDVRRTLTALARLGAVTLAKVGEPRARRDRLAAVTATGT